MQMNTDDTAPGWIDVWRLWRHCLCRFGWYPLFIAPLVTCAAMLDIYSSTGCDFIRMNIGFVPTNDVWKDSSLSYAQLGIFSYDSHQDDDNKWKRSFNNGCQSYSTEFESLFITSDQTWTITRILAYISGISSLVALSTAWLLTVTPLPASFFWPGVLLPAVVLAMLTGAFKFVFLDTTICKEALWFMDGSSSPVPAQSCDIGESSVFCIAAVCSYLICTVLICLRSPQKRILDENYGKRIGTEQVVGSATTDQTNQTDLDPEQGEEQTAAHEPKIISLLKDQEEQAAVSSGNNNVLGIEKRESTSSTKNGKTTSQLITTSHDVTWSTEPTYTTSHRARILSPPPTRVQEEQQKLSEVTEDSEESDDLDWSSHGRPIIVTINDSGQPEPLALSYSEGSTTQTSKGTGSGGNKSSTSMLPPRHHSRKDSHNQLSFKSSSDVGSVHSKISKISLSDSQASDVSTLSAGMHGTSAAPTVVSIPKRRIKSSPAKSRSSPGNRKQHQYAKKRVIRREDRNDVYLNTNEPHSVTPGSNKCDTKRELLLDGWLPRLDEMSASRSLEDHGDLINQCVRDLQASFVDDNRFRTL